MHAFMRTFSGAHESLRFTESGGGRGLDSISQNMLPAKMDSYYFLVLSMAAANRTTGNHRSTLPTDGDVNGPANSHTDSRKAKRCDL